MEKSLSKSVARRCENGHFAHEKRSCIEATKDLLRKEFTVTQGQQCSYKLIDFAAFRYLEAVIADTLLTLSPKRGN
jgi:hypothetical protein